MGKRKLLKKFSVSLRGLLGAEDAVAGVAQTGDDVAVLVQVVVQRSTVDVHIGVALMDEPSTPSGAATEDHQLDILAALAPSSW